MPETLSFGRKSKRRLAKNVARAAPVIPTKREEHLSNDYCHRFKGRQNGLAVYWSVFRERGLVVPGEWWAGERY